MSFDKVKDSVLVVPSFAGYQIREVGTILPLSDGTLIFPYTLAGGGEHRIHYSTSNVNTFQNWIYKGKLGISRQGEDPVIQLIDGVFYTNIEDKEREKLDKIYLISRYSSTDFNPLTNTGTWNFDGEILKPSEDGWDYHAYSPSFFLNRLSPMIYEGTSKAELGVENVGIAIMVDGKYVKSSRNPILKAKDFGFGSISPNELIEDDGKVLLNATVLENGLWVSKVFEGTNELDNWKLQTKELIKSELGLIAAFSTFKTSTGEWKVLYQLVGGNEIYLGTPVKSATNGDNMKPIIKIDGNKLSVVDLIDGEQYSWNYSKTHGGYDGWLAFGDTYDIPDDKQKDGYEFWCYPMSDASKISERIIYSGAVVPIPIPEPNDNAEIVKQIRVLLDKIK